METADALSQSALASLPLPEILRPDELVLMWQQSRMGLVAAVDAFNKQAESVLQVFILNF
jgi:hypothetical protein